MLKLGMPYMGSKRKIAHELMKYIVNQNPNAKYFYDLFGGGGAMSFIALQYPQFEKVVYNELNTGVCELLRKIQREGVTNEFYQWIDRETFQKHKNDNDWFGGLCRIVWSFGNNQISYIYGRNIEKKKKLLHQIIVDKSEQALDLYNDICNTNYYIPNSEEMHVRRLYLTAQHRISIFGKTKLSQHLENIQQLERLQEFERFQRLEILNYSFENVPITTPLNQTVIYCDIPYMKDSAIKRYKNENNYYGNFDFDFFKNWVLNSPYKIYVSSYEFDELHLCKQIGHISTHSATNNSLRVIEKLFCNQPELEYNLFYQAI